MTAIQQQAIQLIQQLPDDKIKAIITLAADEINLIKLQKQDRLARKKNALAQLEKLDLALPDDLDADTELRNALEEKYDTAD